MKTSNLNILYHYRFSEKRNSLHKFRNHVLVYIYSGELEIAEGDYTLKLKQGDCAFIAKDTQLYLKANPYKEIEFDTVFMALPREFLCEFYHTLNRKDLTGQFQKVSLNKLPKRPEITSLFESFKPYYRSSADLSDELTRIKIAEGLYALLRIGDHYHYTLFDFVHKLNIIDILSQSAIKGLSWKKKQNYTLLNHNAN